MNAKRKTIAILWVFMLYVITALSQSMTVNAIEAVDYPDGENGYGNSDEATVKPVLTIDIEGKGNQVIYNTPADIADKTISCSLNVSGAKSKYGATGLIILYDERLSPVLNESGEIATVGNAIDGSMLSINHSENIIFLGSASTSDSGSDGVMWSFRFHVPDNAKSGDIYTIDIAYFQSHFKSAKTVGCFSSVKNDGSIISNNMQAYAFSKGIYNSNNPNNFALSENTLTVSELKNISGNVDAYFAIADSYSEPNNSSHILQFGDPTDDGKIDSKDATFILIEYSLLSTGKTSSLTEEKIRVADVNKDGKLDSKDASLILTYYSYCSTGGTDSLENYI